MDADIVSIPWKNTAMRRLSSILLVAWANLFFASCGASFHQGDDLDAEAIEDAAGAPPIGRLPDDVRPIRYELALRIDPRRETFAGHARIHVRLEKAHRRIWLHGQDLRVDSIAMVVGERKRVATWTQVTEDGVSRVDLATPIGAGEAVLEVAYEADFSRSLSGLYRALEGGDWYAFTQFQATRARLAFPCFDDPAFKTPFQISLTVAPGDLAAGNTPIVDEEQLPSGERRLTLATTKPMPTYLVAWAVGPLEIVEAPPIAPNAVRHRPLPFRAIAVRGKGKKLRHALRYTKSLLENAESYFGTEYPYAKLDVVAIPDFSPGAMENVGLITFREAYLLLGDDPPAWQERAFAEVMAHELAHMWLGNLVTMLWWDDVWLNEGFATWMAAKLVGEAFPEHRPEIGLLEQAERAMRTDSLLNARQIRQPIESNHDIQNAFDPITYGKGGAVISMLEAWLGEEVFRDGLRLYLERHRWGSARTEDLLGSLEEVAGKKVDAAMLSFLEQPGTPLVTAALQCESGGGAALKLTQRRFLPLGSGGDSQQRWTVPICVRYSTDGKLETRCDVLDSPAGTFDLQTKSCPAWVMPNADGGGYFRFALAGNGLRDLIERGLAHLNDRERLALAYSLEAAFESGAATAEEVFAALPVMARSSSRAVATTPMGLLQFAHDRVLDESEKPALRTFSRSIYRPIFDRLGWEAHPNEDSEEALLRAAVIAHLAFTARDNRVRHEALERARAYLGAEVAGEASRFEVEPKALDPNLVGTALAVAVQEGDAAFFDGLLELFGRSTDPLLRQHLLNALASTLDPALAARARALALDERVRVNETGTPLWTQLAQPETREATWSWIVAHRDELIERMGVGASRLPLFGQSFCDLAGATKVRTLFEAEVDHEGRRVALVETIGGGPRNLRATLERIHLCGAKVAHHRDAVRTFFEGERVAARR